MARLNIYLPDDLYELANKWRGTINLSEICARALREELEAEDSHRNIRGLLNTLRPPSELERAVADRYKLSEVLICEPPKTSDLREVLGLQAATYLDRNLCDSSLLATGGGRQMWCMVRNLSPRRVRVTITALGIQQNDPKVLHAHANTLITLLWLLYSPRSEAHLIGADSFASIWSRELPRESYPRYFVVASCAPFDRNSPFAQLIGTEASDELLRRCACGDFAYLFFDDKGDLIEPPSMDHCSILSEVVLQNLSRRSDARVLLVAGGQDKLRILRFTLEAGLCNVLVTDTLSAQHLLNTDGGIA
jgi:deoxyribonucleoside regulator